MADNGVDWAEMKRPNAHFFKALVGDFEKSMKIPPKFLEHLQDDIESKQSNSTPNPNPNSNADSNSNSNLTPIVTATLEGPTGRTWQVKLEKTQKGFYFTSGWSKFVKDHSLMKHELLVFRYNGCMQFNVLIFDKSCCEKEVDENENKGRDFSNLNNLGGVKRKLHSEETVICDSSEEENNNEEDSDELMIIEEPSKSKDKKRTKRRKKEIRSSERRQVTEKEIINAQNAANSFASENHFFVIKLTRRHVYYWTTMRFPIQFSKNYLPRTKCNFVLRVSSDKAWDVTYIPSLNDRDCLSKGWSVFAKENNLEEDDFIAFELIKPNEFQVHIFRVVELNPSL